MARSAIQTAATTLAKKYNISAAEATAFVEAVFSIVSDELTMGNQVKIKGLGTFKVQTVKPRESVNVNTGERVLIAGHDKVSFTPDAAMKELVNKPFSQFETVVINDGVDTEDLERIPLGYDSDSTKSAETAEPAPVVVVEQQVADKQYVSEQKSFGQESYSAGQQEMVDDTLKNDDILNTKENIADNVMEKAEREDAQKLDTAPDAVAVATKFLSIKNKELSDAGDISTEKVTRFSEEVDVVEKTISEDTDEEDVDASSHRLLRVVALLSLAVIIGLGVFFWKKLGNSMDRKAATVVGVHQRQVSTAQAASHNLQPNTASRQSENRPSVVKTDSFATLNNDVRIRYGAYNIVGVDRVVVLRKGQTMESYSRKLLGPDMVGYFQVLNGCNTMHAGDTMKVPRVELRPEYRTRK